jgi:hypothetical protein
MTLFTGLVFNIRRRLTGFIVGETVNWSAKMPTTYVYADDLERWKWNHRRKSPQRPLRLTFGPRHSGSSHEQPAGSGLWGRISKARPRHGPSRRAKAERAANISNVLFERTSV